MRSTEGILKQGGLLNQIAPIIDSVNKFTVANGLLALCIVLVVLTVLLIFMGLVVGLLQVIKLQSKQLDASSERDKQIANVARKADDVMTRQTGLEDQIEDQQKTVDTALAGLTKGLADINASMLISGKAHVNSAEHVVSALNEHSTAIGETSKHIESNSNTLAQNIIDTVNALKVSLESPEGIIRTDMKEQADRILQSLREVIVEEGKKDKVIDRLNLKIQELEAEKLLNPPVNMEQAQKELSAAIVITPDIAPPPAAQ